MRVAAICIRQNFPDVENIRVAIVQHRFKSNFNACNYSPSELDYAERELLFTNWRNQQPDAPRSAGTHCRYCRAAAVCGEYAVYSQMPAAIARLGLDFAKKDIIARVQELSHADLAYIQSRSTAANNLFEAVKARLKSLPEAELNANGLTLGKPSKVAEVKKVDGARELMVDSMKLVTKEEFDEHVSLTLGKLEKIAVPRLAKRNDTNQKVAKEQLRQALVNCITFSEKAASLEPYVAEDKQIQE